MSASTSPNRWERLLTHPRFTLGLIVIALLLTTPSLTVGLQFDDYLLRTTIQTAPNPLTVINTLFVLMDGNPVHTRQKMETGQFPWYSLPTGQVSFWRPLSAFTHWLDFTLWPNTPWLMHAQNLLWFALFGFAVCALYRQLKTTFTPTNLAWPPLLLTNLAALLYLLDDAHGFAVGWISNRNALLSALFGFLALLAHHHWRHSHNRTQAFLSLFWLALALLSGEAGLATLAYLLAYALCLDSAQSQQRLASLLPSLIVVALWRIAYSAQGFGAYGTSYIDPGREPLRFAGALTERLPILLLGQWALPPAELYPLLTPPMSTIFWVFAILILIGLFILFWPLLRNSRLARFFALGMILSAIPPSASLPANRLFFFIGFGAFGLLALYVCSALYSSIPTPQSLIAKLLLGFNLLQAIALPLTAYSPALLGTTEPSIASLPTDSTFAQQTAIFVNAPSHFYVAHIPDIRAVTQQPIPAHILFLAPGTGTVTLTRFDANTLIAQPQAGYLSGFDAVFRDSSQPFQPNQIIQLPEANVKILALTSDQRPVQVAFHFNVPLEDSTLRWLQWQAGHYIPYQPPAVGQTVTMSPAVSYWPTP